MGPGLAPPARPLPQNNPKHAYQRSRGLGRAKRRVRTELWSWGFEVGMSPVQPKAGSSTEKVPIRPVQRAPESGHKGGGSGANESSGFKTALIQTVASFTNTCIKVNNYRLLLASPAVYCTQPFHVQLWWDLFSKCFYCSLGMNKITFIFGSVLHRWIWTSLIPKEIKIAVSCSYFLTTINKHTTVTLRLFHIEENNYWIDVHCSDLVHMRMKWNTGLFLMIWFKETGNVPFKS